jgi:hypothetical protein
VPDEITRQVEDLLIAPLPVLLEQTAAAVGEAQILLDDAAIRTTQRLAELRAGLDPDDDPTGLTAFDVAAPWYHMPEVEVDISLSLTVQVRTETRTDGSKVFFPRLAASPRNAASRKVEDTSVTGTSRLRARITAVPPPTNG